MYINYIYSIDFINILHIHVYTFLSPLKRTVEQKKLFTSVPSYFT